MNHLESKTVLKSSSRSRWSARHEACKSLCISWNEIISALHAISNDSTEKALTRNEAIALRRSLTNMDTCFLSILWNDILERFDKVNKQLQSVYTFSTLVGTKLKEKITILQHYEFIHAQKLIDIYPNVGNAIRIFLIAPISNCTAERSFSALKRVKNYLRSSIGEEKLNNLAVLYIYRFVSAQKNR